jgi:hypothetical protein
MRTETRQKKLLVCVAGVVTIDKVCENDGNGFYLKREFTGNSPQATKGSLDSVPFLAR